MTMREFLDDLNLPSFSFAYFATIVFALPSELDAIAARLVHSAMHAMPDKFALCKRKHIGLVVVNVRSPMARPI
jgi:hypothetical protein